MVAVWLLVIAATAPLQSRFDGAQSNEAASFLPGGSESLVVNELSSRFPSGEQVPAVVVFARDGELTSADRAAVEDARTAIGSALPAVAGPPLPTVFAPDGRAAIITIPMEVGGDSDALVDAVDGFRQQLGGLPAGLDAKVGGPAGFSADAIEVFESINGRLLLATTLIVFLLLILIYRSPIFWLVPLVAVFFAEALVRATGYLLTEAGVRVNGQSAGILLVLVFGAGTDYALLLVSRYREELHRHEDRHEAMRIALTQAGPAILASAGTVVAGLLCLSLAEVNGTAGLGQIGALGVAIAAIAMVTLLPALLVVTGRKAFWPFIPRYSPEEPASRTSLFLRLGQAIARAPRRIWVATLAGLLVMAGGLVSLDFGLTSANGFRGDVEAVAAQNLINRSFPAGANAPTLVLVRDPARVDAARDAVTATPGVAELGPVEHATDGTLARFTVTLEAEPYSEPGYAAIPRLRGALASSVGSDVALVGGPTAEERDLRVAAQRDNRLLPPIVLLVVLLILVALLRALVAPLVLVGTVIVSYAAAVGLSVFLFEHVFDFPGVDPSFLLFAFIFLVALGVDYNIFLMARVREEAVRHGTREGILRGLAATGSVITSAGIVLAGTFAVLGVLPLVALTEIGFAVAFGVLLDTLVVRSILVPAIGFDLDHRLWAPSRLSRPPRTDR